MNFNFNKSSYRIANANANQIFNIMVAVTIKQTFCLITSNGEEVSFSDQRVHEKIADAKYIT